MFSRHHYRDLIIVEHIMARSPRCRREKPAQGSASPHLYAVPVFEVPCSAHLAHYSMGITATITPRWWSPVWCLLEGFSAKAAMITMIGGMAVIFLSGLPG